MPQTKEDFPGTTKKLVDDIKTAGWEGGKVRESAGHFLPVPLRSQHPALGLAPPLPLTRCRAYRTACLLHHSTNPAQRRQDTA